MEEKPEKSVTRDGGWGWVVVFSSFAIHVINDGITYSFGIFYDEFLAYFREDKSKTAWIISILCGMTLCSGPIASVLVNKFGCRLVAFGGTILAVISLFLSSFANSVTSLCLTIGVGTGLGFGLIYLPAMVSVTNYFEKKRSLATGITVCGAGIGTFIFPPIIIYLLEKYFWRGTMIILAGIVMECAIFGACFRPLQQPTNKLFDFSLLQNKIFILFIASNFLTGIGFNTPYVYIVSKATSLGITPTDAGFLLSLIGISNTLGRITIGFIADKPWANKLQIYNYCLAICGLATASSVFAVDFYPLAIFACVFGFTLGAYVSLTSVVLVDLLGLEKMTNAFGMLLLFQGLATLIGPPIGGMLYDLLESYDAAFYLAGLTIGGSGLMLIGVTKINGGNQEKEDGGGCDNKAV